MFGRNRFRMCENCRNFFDAGSLSSCDVGGCVCGTDHCDLFAPVGDCGRCAFNKGTFDCRGAQVVLCEVRNEHVRFKTGCARFMEKEE